MNIFGLNDAMIVGFVMVFARLGGFFAVAPIFGSRIVPVQLRVGVALILTVALAPLSKLDSIQVGSLPELVVQVAGEFVIGLAMGLVIQLLFAAIQAAGQFIDLMIGFSFANIVDPVSTANISVLGQLYNMIAILTFFAVNGHLLMVEALARTFSMLPLGQSFASGALYEVLTRHFADIAFIGLQIAAPVAIALVLTNVFFGIMTRAMPRMNVFFVGLPFSITIGLVFVGLTMGFAVPFIADSFSGGIENMGRVAASFVRG